MKFIVGYKQAMTQQYREDGTVVPVTAVLVDPLVITQVKTAERDGYNALQFGIGEKKKVGKSQAGHLLKILATGKKPFARLQEMPMESVDNFKVGDTIAINLFEPGDKVTVSGTSKGKGFQGVVKRHGFAGSPASHGHKDQLRMPGSIGAQDAQRVFKGMRMGGRMGGDRVTIKNLEIVNVDEENNVLYVKGALPGARNGLVEIVGEGELAIDLNVFDSKSEEVNEAQVPENDEQAKPAESVDVDAPKGDKKEEQPAESKTDPKEEVKDEKKDEPTQ